MDLTTVRNVVGALREQVHRVVVGQDHAIDLLMTALLCEGHVLFEGVHEATSVSPLWAALGNWRMFGDILRGRERI